MGFLLRVIVNALAIILAGHVISGLRVDGLLAAAGAGLVLGIINALVRPILIILTLPITLFTLGLFLLVLNGFCLWLVAALVPGFAVTGFGAAFLGALIVSAVSWVVTAFVSDAGRIVIVTRR